MTTEHLISTMRQADCLSLITEMNCRSGVVVVNQAMPFEREETILRDDTRVKIIHTSEKGLVRSRNLLLRNAGGDIEIIGDDDVVYAERYLDHIREAYQSFPDADIIVFQYAKTTNPQKAHNAVQKAGGRIGWRNVSRIRSIEVTFRRASVLDSGITFDEAFGLGAKYQTGEESVFMADALRAGLKIYYYPAILCVTPPTPESKAKFAEGYDRAYFLCKGACFYRMYGTLFPLLSALFLLKKRRSVLCGQSFFRALSWMLQGRADYKKTKGETI